MKHIRTWILLADARLAPPSNMGRHCWRRIIGTCIGSRCIGNRISGIQRSGGMVALLQSNPTASPTTTDLGSHSPRDRPYPHDDDPQETLGRSKTIGTGRNLAIEYRWAEDQNDRLPALAGQKAPDLPVQQVIELASISNTHPH
jgi:hypothetical protein